MFPPRSPRREWLIEAVPVRVFLRPAATGVGRACPSWAWLTTNSIRGGANRRALQAAVNGQPIFEAWSDEPWVIDGAAVRVSLICFGRADDAWVS